MVKFPTIKEQIICFFYLHVIVGHPNVADGFPNQISVAD